MRFGHVYPRQSDNRLPVRNVRWRWPPRRRSGQACGAVRRHFSHRPGRPDAGMLERRDSYEALYRDFRWKIPRTLQHRHRRLGPLGGGRAHRIALLDYRADGAPLRLTYGELAARSNALANGLRSLGIWRGDRVALLLPQCFETAIAHVGDLQARRRSPCRWRCCSGSRRSNTGCTAAGVKAVITNAAGEAKLAQDHGQAAGPGSDRRRSTAQMAEARRFPKARSPTIRPSSRPSRPGRTIRR